MRVRARDELVSQGITCTRRTSTRHSARLHVRRRDRRADDHHDRPEAHPRGSRRDASLARAREVPTASHVRRRRPMHCSSRRRARASSRRRARARHARPGIVELDALVSSGKDEAERYHTGQIDPEPRLVVTKSGALRRLGAAGRSLHRGGLPPEPHDAYGAGGLLRGRPELCAGSSVSRAWRRASSRPTAGVGALAGPGVPPKRFRCPEPGRCGPIGAELFPFRVRHCKDAVGVGVARGGSG